MAKGSSSKVGAKVPNLGRLPVKATPKVKAKPNAVKQKSGSRGSVFGGPGGTRSR